MTTSILAEKNAIQIGQIEKATVSAGKKMLPDISIVLPFEPKIFGKRDIERKLEQAEYKVALELGRSYSREEAFPLLSRLRKTINNLNYSTFKKSIAIFLSDSGDRVYYLNIPVTEHIAVGAPFDMHELINNKKESQRCLLLVLSGEKMKIFEATSTHLMRVMLKVPDVMDAFRNDVPERVSHFSDPSARREVLLDKFLHFADYALGALLNHEHLPVFVMATEKTVGHFMKITANKKYISGHIYGNYEDAPEYALMDAITPELNRWEKIKQEHLLSRLDIATGAGKVVCGIRPVCREAAMKRGQLLIVERNYAVPLESIRINDNDKFFIRDAVDKAISDVLDSGGDVEFVDEGTLVEYRKVALIRYY